MLVFNKLEPALQRKVVSEMYERSVSAGEILIKEGDSGAAASELYVVKAGKFEVRALRPAAGKQLACSSILGLWDPVWLAQHCNPPEPLPGSRNGIGCGLGPWGWSFHAARGCSTGYCCLLGQCHRSFISNSPCIWQSVASAQ